MLTITPKCTRLGRGQSAGELAQEDKEKNIGFITQSTNLIVGNETDTELLSSTAKIVQNFENPKLPSENDAEYLAAVERGDMQKSVEIVKKSLPKEQQENN